jgi:hypothetical protein
MGMHSLGWLTSPLVIEEGAYASDGGSIYIRVRDSAGATHNITLWQHMFIEEPDPDRLPGRLYVDKTLVPVRSEGEGQLLAALRGARLKVEPTEGDAAPKRSGPGMIVGQDLRDYAAKIDEGPAAALAHLVQQLIDYVASEAYVELARALSADEDPA